MSIPTVPQTWRVLGFGKHPHAPAAKIILVRNPADALPAIGRVLGASAPEH